MFHNLEIILRGAVFCPRNIVARNFIARRVIAIALAFAPIRNQTGEDRAPYLMLAKVRGRGPASARTALCPAVRMPATGHDYRTRKYSQVISNT